METRSRTEFGGALIEEVLGSCVGMAASIRMLAHLVRPEFGSCSVKVPEPARARPFSKTPLYLQRVCGDVTVPFPCCFPMYHSPS